MLYYIKFDRVPELFDTFLKTAGTPCLDFQLFHILVHKLHTEMAAIKFSFIDEKPIM